MEVQFAKWSNSLAPIPFNEAPLACHSEGADLELKRGKLAITPRPYAYCLDELVAGITKDNLHGEVQTGVAVGAEEAG